MRSKQERSDMRPQVEHTPTPWIVQEGLSLDPSRKYYVGESENGKQTAFQALKKANAERIVRAVNAHERLLIAAKEALELFEALTGGREADKRTEDTMNDLSEAIAKAEGK